MLKKYIYAVINCNRATHQIIAATDIIFRFINSEADNIVLKKKKKRFAITLDVL